MCGHQEVGQGKDSSHTLHWFHSFRSTSGTSYLHSQPRSLLCYLHSQPRSLLCPASRAARSIPTHPAYLPQPEREIPVCSRTNARHAAQRHAHRRISLQQRERERPPTSAKHQDRPISPEGLIASGREEPAEIAPPRTCLGVSCTRWGTTVRKSDML
jgi:hypothetical protein